MQFYEFQYQFNQQSLKLTKQFALLKRMSTDRSEDEKWEASRISFVHKILEEMQDSFQCLFILNW